MKWPEKLYKKLPKMIQPWVFYKEVSDMTPLALYRREGSGSPVFIVIHYNGNYRDDETSEFYYEDELSTWKNLEEELKTDLAMVSHLRKCCEDGWK